MTEQKEIARAICDVMTAYRKYERHNKWNSDRRGDSSWLAPSEAIDVIATARRGKKK
jgi:hypothetical protein